MSWKEKRTLQRRINWEPWALQTIARDNNTCVDCGVTESLIVHHLDESRKKGALNMNNNLDNLVTLCRPCHARRHGQTNDREDVREMRMMGMSLGEIGRKLKVSRQRIYQIIRKQKDWENIESAFWRHKDPIDKR